jgi:hypothetical protein
MHRPPRITWLVVGGVLALLVAAGVDALRSLSESPAPPAPTQGFASPTTASNDSPVPTTILSAENFAPVEGAATYTLPEGSLRVRKYVAQALAICIGANAGFQSAADVAFEEAAAAASEWAIANLRALSPPRADRALVNQLLSAMERERDALRQFGSQKRIRATHQKDALADRLSARWRLSPPEVLRACPVSLPA